MATPNPFMPAAAAAVASGEVRRVHHDAPISSPSFIRPSLTDPHPLHPSAFHDGLQ
jgi:hypothetical protein